MTRTISMEQIYEEIIKIEKNMATKKEMEEKLLARKIALKLIKLDERTLDEKLEDLETGIEDFKDREAGREVDRLVSAAKKEGGSDKAMFEDPPEKKKFSWSEIGEINEGIERRFSRFI